MFSRYHLSYAPECFGLFFAVIKNMTQCMWKKMVVASLDVVLIAQIVSSLKLRSFFSLAEYFQFSRSRVIDFDESGFFFLQPSGFVIIYKCCYSYQFIC